MSSQSRQLCGYDVLVSFRIYIRDDCVIPEQRQVLSGGNVEGIPRGQGTAGIIKADAKIRNALLMNNALYRE